MPEGVGYRVGNKRYPGTPAGRLAAQEYARKQGLRVEADRPKPTPAPGQTPVQRRIQEKKKGPPSGY
jgi:hypothetical protein